MLLLSRIGIKCRTQFLLKITVSCTIHFTRKMLDNTIVNYTNYKWIWLIHNDIKLFIFVCLNESDQTLIKNCVIPSSTPFNYFVYTLYFTVLRVSYTIESQQIFNYFNIFFNLLVLIWVSISLKEISYNLKQIISLYNLLINISIHLI